VRPALPGSYEDRLHALRVDRCWIDLSEDAARVELADSRLQRAIGVIYRPETERVSHYFRCLLPEQFDVLVHVDHTSALEPLDLTSGWEVGEAPDTYPWAV
jgi:erythromycin esterase-like protein